MADRVKVPALVLAVWVLGSGVAIACSCYTPGAPDEATRVYRNRADAVFEGRVTELAIVEAVDVPVNRKPGDVQAYARAVLHVSAIWKGDVSENVVVYTPLSPGSCGSEFLLGECIVVFAEALEGAFYTHRCMGTWSERPRSTYLSSLGEPADVLKEPWCNFAQKFRH